ncbi:hypothetical protein [Streptococcus dentiloxodontae]
MMFLRRRVFIGEYRGQAVYYDQKTGAALSAPKSTLLNTEGAKKTNDYIPLIVVLLIGGGPGVFAFFSLPSIGVYNWQSLSYILLLWLAEFIVLTAILEIGLYKNVRQAQPTSKRVFWEAACGNLMVSRDSHFDPAKGSTALYRIVRGIMVGCCFYSLYLVYHYAQQFGQPIKLSYDLWIMGLIWFVTFLLYNQNNPVRFMKIMRLYSEDKVIFKNEESNENVR